MRDTGSVVDINDTGPVGDSGLVGDSGRARDSEPVGDSGLVGDSGRARDSEPVGDSGLVGDSGMVTAEAAAATAALSFLAVAMSWVIALSIGQGQLLAGAREGARAAARGESSAGVLQSAARVAPRADVRIHRSGGHVRVVLTQRREPPGPLAGLGRTLRAEAVAAVEP